MSASKKSKKQTFLRLKSEYFLLRAKLSYSGSNSRLIDDFEDSVIGVFRSIDQAKAYAKKFLTPAPVYWFDDNWRTKGFKTKKFYLIERVPVYRK